MSGLDSGHLNRTFLLTVIKCQNETNKMHWTWFLIIVTVTPPELKRIDPTAQEDALSLSK